MSRPAAGSIVLVDWRSGALPAEPTNRRPAVVVEDDVFPDAYPNLLVVPLTRDQGLAYPSFAERIDPTPENGAPQTCWALAHHVTSVSLKRVTATPSRVTAEQLAGVRRRIALAIGAQPGRTPRPGSPLSPGIVTGSSASPVRATRQTAGPALPPGAGAPLGSVKRPGQPGQGQRPALISATSRTGSTTG